MAASSREGVSVVIPAYNVAGYLTKGVRSVLKGTYEYFEIIIVDDASTDATPDVIRSLELEDPRIRSIRLPQNGGPSAARNVGIDQARLEWVALLDSDDWWAPERLQYLLSLATDTRADIVSDDIYLVAEGAQKSWTTMYELHQWTQLPQHLLQAHELCERDWILKPMVKRQWLRDKGLWYDESLNFGEDFTFFLETLLQSAHWVMGDKAFYFYLSRPGALTRSLRIGEALIASAEKLAADPRIRENPLLYRAFMKRLDRIRAAHWRNQLVHKLRNKDWLNAATMVCSSPTNILDLFGALQQRRKLHTMRKERSVMKI